MEFVFHWYDIFLCIWFAFVLSVLRFKNYRHVLIANIMGATSFTLYALLKDEPVAAAMTAIAATSGLVQLAIPASNERKFVIARNITALIAAFVACFLFYQKPADILPCISTFIMRFGEAQQSAKILKISMLAGAIIWVCFAYMAGLYLMIPMELIIIALFSYKLLKDDRVARPVT